MRPNPSNLGDTLAVTRVLNEGGMVAITIATFRPFIQA